MENRTIKYGCICVVVFLFSCTHINYSDDETFIAFKADGVERTWADCPLFCHIYSSGSSYHVFSGIVNQKNERIWHVDVEFDSLVNKTFPIRADSAYYVSIGSGTYLSVGGINDTISLKIDPATGMITGHFSFLGFNGSDTIHITDGVFLAYCK